MMPDHPHPDEPFYVRAVTELQDIEEAMTLAGSATELTSTLSTLLIKRLRLEMANLPTDMKLELAESQRNATRTPSPQLTPCEQLKYSKARLAKMETFPQMKAGLRRRTVMMPDHHLMNPSTSEQSLSYKTSKKP
ncbi:hypothetical protein TNCV_1851511 [Trichonephila clavipes]|nr:hypothetical protein TNCV_1851511 [Trichonephila clavipes]